MHGGTLDGWRVHDYGRSRDDVPLKAFLPEQPVEGLFTAGIHGEEAMGSLLVRRLLEQVSGAQARWAVVPVVNPDGLLAGTRQNAAGVDLNRNFPATTWRPDDSFTYPPGIEQERRIPVNRTNLSSPGDAPGSEPETQALMQLIEELRPALVVDVHSPLDVMLVRRGFPAEVVEHLSQAAQIGAVDEIPGCPGAFDDWLDDVGIPAIVYELEHAGLPAVCARHLPGLKRLARGELSRR